METSPHWKRVWRAVTGRSVNATPDVVEEALKLAKDYLLKGIEMYPKFSEDSFTKCAEKVELKEYPDLSKFIHEMSVALDLDACVAWAVFCNYLMFDYYGKVEDMQKITNYEATGKTFITNVWQFYTLERTYLLRILQCIIENYKDTCHKFHQQYHKFVQEVTMTKLRTELFSQFSHLMTEIPEEYSETAISINHLVERNNAELIQILLIILSSVRHEPLDIKEFLKLFGLLKEHTFAPTSQMQHILKLSRPQALETIQSIELATFIAGMHNFWFSQEEWYPRIDDIEKMIKEVYTANQGSIVLLTWSALQSTLPGDLAKLIYEQHSHMYVSKALEKLVFVELCRVISNPVFENCSAGNIAKTAMYKLFDILCIQFGAEAVYAHDGTVSLCAQLLQDPDIAFSWKDMEGVSSFFLHALKLFPFHFQSLSKMMQSFISLKEDTKSVIQELTVLKTFTDKYVPPEMNGPHITNNFLRHMYKPLDNDLIVFPYGSPAEIIESQEEILVQIQGEWSYFKLLRHVVVNFLEEAEKTHHYSLPLQEIVLSGYKLILELLEDEPNLAWENTDITHLLRLALCLLSVSTKPQTKNLELLKMMFQITIHIFKHDPADVVRALIAIEFLPKLAIANITPQDFDKTYLLSEATLIHHIEEEFSQDKSCNLLLLYIQFVKEATKMGIYYSKLQLPACMFLLVKVFPVFIRQLFSENHKTQKVLVDLVDLMHMILTSTRTPTADGDLYNSVMELFLHNQVYAKNFMKLFECGNNRLQLLLCTETNWTNGPLILVVQTIEKVLECVLLLLKHIKLNEPKKYQGFEELLYWWDSPSFSVLRVISSYINHSISAKIPKLACKILTAFVKISNKPLLNSLQFDDYQLQSLFLERLRDSLDDQEMRVAVVKLVTACVNEQSSMTSGFFNMSPKGENSDVSILSFLAEYLQNIEKNPNSLLVPIQAAILDLFHELWKNNKQHLLMKVTDQQSFWMSLTTPLLKPNDVPMEIMLQILEIIVIEMHFSRSRITEMFDKEFKTIFEDPQRFLNIWMDRLIEISYDDTKLSDSSEVSLIVAFLTIWKNFVLSVKLLNPEYFEQKWNKSFFMQKCLDGLLHYISNPRDINVLTLWGELALIFVKFPVLENDTVKETIFETLKKIANSFSSIYNIVDESCRTIMLTVMNIIVTNLKEFLIANPTHILPLVTPFENLFYFEYKMLFTDKSSNEDHYRNWMLILCIVRTFLCFDTVSDCEYFFIHVRFVERMVEVLGHCITHSLPVKMTEITAITLVEISDSELVHHFDHLNIRRITEQLLPPKTLILQSNRFPNGIIPQHLKDWWSIYYHIVRLNCNLLLRRKGYAAKYSLDFVYVHQVVLMDALLSATVLADSTNLNLVNEILRFIYIVLEYRGEWTLCDPKLFDPIMSTIKEVLNSSIGIILRPKCLIFVPHKSVTPKTQMDPNIPTQYLISVINSFLDIITWSCKCFSRCNPPFINLLDMYRPSNFKVLVEYDFRVPTATNDNMQVLTYGGLLCALHFTTKVLSQIFFQERERASESTDMTPKYDTSPTASPTSASTPTPTSETPRSKAKGEQYFNVIILPTYTKETAESINVLHSFTIPDLTGLQAPWLTSLSAECLISALNAIISFLAGQVFLTLHDNTIERTLKRYVKREMCSEFSQFYDFVIKFLNDKFAPADTRVMAVPRRVHNKSKLRSCTKALNIADTKLVVDIMGICSDRPSSKRTNVTEVEDCYLLTLVHWFRHVCRLVHYSKFDEFLSRWHAKSTYVMPHSTFVKNTSVHISDEEDETK